MNLISGGNQFCRKSELFGQSSCIWISKVLYTKVHRHSLDFNAFCIIQEEFSQSLEISTNWRRGTLFLGGTIFAESLDYLVPPFCIWILKVLYIKNSSSLIRFQCMLHEWKVLFSETWNFYKLNKGDPISGGNQLWRKSEIFGPPCCISVLKVSETQIHRYSLDFNAFCMIQELFSQSLEIYIN